MGRRGERAEHRGPRHAHVAGHRCRQAAERGAGMPLSCSGPSCMFRVFPGMCSPCEPRSDALQSLTQHYQTQTVLRLAHSSEAGPTAAVATTQ